MRFPSIFRCENVSFREGKAQHVGFAELRFGPRALGHRSLLAVPDSDKMRDRPLALKGLVKRVSWEILLMEVIRLQGFIHPNGGCLGFLNHQQYHQQLHSILGWRKPKAPTFTERMKTFFWSSRSRISWQIRGSCFKAIIDRHCLPDMFKCQINGIYIFKKRNSKNSN